MSSQWMFLLRKDAGVVLILLFLAIGVGGCRQCRHWRVDRNRQNRNCFFVFQLSNQVNKLLGATDSKGRNEHRGLSLGGIVDDARESHFRILGIVKAVAVS